MKKTSILLIFLLLVGPVTASADNEIKALYEATKSDFNSLMSSFSKLNSQRAGEWKEFQTKTYAVLKNSNNKVEDVSRKGASETEKGVQKANQEALDKLGKAQIYLKDHTKKSFEYARTSEKKTEEEIKKLGHSD